MSVCLLVPWNFTATQVIRYVVCCASKVLDLIIMSTSKNTKVHTYTLVPFGVTHAELVIGSWRGPGAKEEEQEQRSHCKDSAWDLHLQALHWSHHLTVEAAN